MNYEANSGSHTPSPNEANSQFTLLRLFNILLARWRLVVFLPLTLMILVVVPMLLSDRSYLATATLTPDDGSTSDSRLSGIAAQFGISVAPAGGGEGIVYYQQLFKSREILRQLAYTTYHTRSGSGPKDTAVVGNFIQISNITGASANDRTLLALQTLEAMIGVSTDLESNIITVTVASPMPGLALQMNKRLLQLTDGYNREQRRSRARAEREFIEGRLTEARSKLRGAEEQLERFLDNNRAFASSPQLVFEHDRLQRKVAEEQAIYSALAQSFEQARIDEVRNTPVLSVITPPETVIEPVARGTVTKGLLAGLIGFIIAALIAFTRAIFEHKRATASDDYETFIILTRSIVSGALRVFPQPVRVRVRSKLPALYESQDLTARDVVLR